MKVNIQIALDDTSQYELPSLEEFEQWAKAVVRDEFEIGVRIVEKNESAALNHRYRQCSSPTNVLAFPFETPLPEGKNYLGDVVITAALTEEEARQQGKAIKSHWVHLFVHGLLHLQGYDHHDDDTTAEMQAYETKVLNLLGFPDPYGVMSPKSADT